MFSNECLGFLVLQACSTVPNWLLSVSFLCVPILKAIGNVQQKGFGLRDKDFLCFPICAQEN